MKLLNAFDSQLLKSKFDFLLNNTGVKIQDLFDEEFIVYRTDFIASNSFRALRRLDKAKCAHCHLIFIVNLLTS